MKENLQLWKMATLASPESFGALPASATLPAAATANANAGTANFSSKNDLEDIMPPDWEKYNYTLKDFDSVLLSAYSQLKQCFPGTYVNAKDGKRVNSWCGLRSPACTIGAAKSAHKTGKALDLHHGTKLNELRNFCESAEGLKLGIKRIEHREDTKTWVHIDVMPPNTANWKDKTKPYVFKP
ncbi:MAG: hypothetical protein LBH25_04140 [Fibromonadaceae bacterium]|jgi:uncharacterized protein YcbK (DUF882 family)|nr:hypothetical protein [Fibromonadaceae bacterium]